MAPACPSCGEENPEQARFCLACASPLGTKAASAAPVRKLTTLLFTDVRGSTAMAERLDPEAVREVMNRYFDTSREVLERHGGTVEKFVGDAVMAAFGIPLVHEDDALRAVRAAAELREAMTELNSELEGSYGATLEIRTGVNTGEVIAGDPAAGQAFVSGDPVNVAARLEQAAPPGEVLIGEATQRLVRDAVSVEATEPLKLKGKSEPVPAYLLREVTAREPGVARRHDLPLIGREDQVLELEDLFSQAVENSRCELVTIYADAGTGKTRLACELRDRLAERAQTIEGRCSAYQDGGSLWPLKRALERRAGTLPEDTREDAAMKLGGLAPGAAERIDPLLAAFGLRDRAAEETATLRSARALLETMAAERPLLLVFDDLHWAGDALLDLLRYLRRNTTSAPLLILCLARGELKERHAEWAEQEGAAEITLAPLGKVASRRLVSTVLEGEPPEGLTEVVLEHARGNPLFAVEILDSLIEEGHLRRRNGVWSAAGDLRALDLPMTVEALLSARIDALVAPERAAIEAAAVTGEVFWDGALREIDPEIEDLDRSLHALLQKGLVGAERSVFPDQRAFRFSHGLVRVATYRSISKRRRSALHERLANWLEARTAGRAGENDQIIGTHLEAAYRLRCELGPPDGEAVELGRRAGELLAGAGADAYDRGEIGIAVELLKRATSLLPAGHSALPELLNLLGRALGFNGEPRHALEIHRQGAREAEAAGDRRWQLITPLFVTQLQAHLGEEDDLAELRRLAEEALSAFAEQGDEIGVAEAQRALRLVEAEGLQLRKSTDRVEQILSTPSLTPRASDLSDYAGALRIGPVPVEDAIARLDALGSMPELQDIWMVAQAEIATQGLAPLEAMRGDFERAREFLASADAFYEEFGRRYDQLWLAGFACGPIEIMAGDLEAAQRALKEGIEGLREAGFTPNASSILPDLAQVLFAQGRFEEAETAAREARELTAPWDLHACIRWRAIAAKLYARRGELDEAERAAREAVAIAEPTDALNDHAGALLGLAYVLRVADRGGEAVEAVGEALALYEAKGNTVDARRAEEFLRDRQG